MSSTGGLDPRPAPILFVHYGENWIRGSERCLLDLLQHIDRARFRPWVWCNAPALEKAVRDLGVPVELDRFTMLGDWAPPRFAFGHTARLVAKGVRLIRRHRIRLVHANSGAPNQWMLLAARAARVPHLAHLHALYDLRGRCIFGLHHVPVLVGVSPESVMGLEDDGVPTGRTRVILNGVDPDRLAAGDATGLRARLGIAAEDVVFTSIGSLIERKGFFVLLRAFAKLRSRIGGVRLLLVGEGPERSEIEMFMARQGIGDAVTMMGERDDVGAILRDATDVCVTASYEEAFGLTVVEAQALGVPVVTTRVAGSSLTVDPGVTGFVVPVGHADAMADAMETFARDGDLRRRFGAAGLDLVRRRLLIRHYVAAFEALYDELLATPRSAFGWTRNWGPLKPMRALFGGWLRRRLARDRPPEGEFKWPRDGSNGTSGQAGDPGRAS